MQLRIDAPQSLRGCGIRTSPTAYRVPVRRHGHERLSSSAQMHPASPMAVLLKLHTNPFDVVLHGEAQMSGTCQAIFAKVVRMLCGAL